jgi:hypothetical protein
MKNTGARCWASRWTITYILVAVVAGFCGSLWLYWYPGLERDLPCLASPNPILDHLNKDAIWHTKRGWELLNQYDWLVNGSYYVDHFPQFVICPILIALFLTHTIRLISRWLARKGKSRTE